MEHSWIDEFIRRVRPYIFVREEDNLLIRMPNQAHRLNPQGVRVLKFLLDGGTIAGLEHRLGRDPDKLADVALFVYEVKRCLEGKLSESNRTRAVEVQPLGLGFAKLPVLSEVAVTPRCNLRCSFCYYGCGSAAQGSRGALLYDVIDHRRQTCEAPEAGKREMTATEIGRVLEIIYHEAKTPSVSFTGGEPTLRPDLPRLVGRAKEIGLRVNLITNGTLVTLSLAGELKAAGLDSAQVSLEGVTAETHEAITGVVSSFEKTVGAVKNFLDQGITVHTNTTLNLRNLEESTRIPGFVGDVLGLERFSMNLVIPSGSAKDSAVSADPLLIRYADVGPAVEKILAESERAGVEFMWYSPTPLCMFNPITHGLGNKGCSACDGLLSIDCNGDVLPCSSWNEPVGNLLAGSFSEIWQSRGAEACRLKSMAHPGCKSCDSFAVCHGACPLYWRHFDFGELVGGAGFEEPAMAGVRRK